MELLRILFFTLIVSSGCKKQSVISNNSNQVINKNISNNAGTFANNGLIGVSWADNRDNFVDGKLSLKGLDSTSTYTTVQATANSILTIFQNNGSNTVRLPINPGTVNSTWWNAYCGTIDKALSKGMKVIICAWDSKSRHDGRIDNMTAFNTMWNTVITKYGSNANVYFEIFNEPSYATDAEWMNIAAQWISNYPSIPKNRILVSGTPSVSSNVMVVGADSRFNGCLLALHFYRFFYYNLRVGTTVFKPELQTVPQWEALLESKIGAYASRTVITEFGDNMTPVTMDGGTIDSVKYNGSPNSSIRAAAMQAITNVVRKNQMGSIHWAGYGQGGYDMFVISGTVGTVQNASALDQVKYGWGLTAAPTPTFDPLAYYRIINVKSGLALDVDQGSLNNNAPIIQYAYYGGTNQQWRIVSGANQCFEINNKKSGKALDVAGSSLQAGASVIQYTSYGGNNQQWQITPLANGNYEISNRNSSKALDVTNDSINPGSNIVQDTWNRTLYNQQWQIVKL